MIMEIEKLKVIILMFSEQYDNDHDIVILTNRQKIKNREGLKGLGEVKLLTVSYWLRPLCMYICVVCECVRVYCVRCVGACVCVCVCAGMYVCGR